MEGVKKLSGRRKSEHWDLGVVPAFVSVPADPAAENFGCGFSRTLPNRGECRDMDEETSLSRFLEGPAAFCVVTLAAPGASGKQPIGEEPAEIAHLRTVPQFHKRFLRDVSNQ